MDSKTKLEQVLELVINEETEKASDLLHDIFVEKSRTIYADLIDEDAAVEDVIEEDEDQVEEEDLEETIDVSDEEDDFIEDIADAEEEIDAEEAFGEDADEDEAEDDLAAELADDEGEGDAEADAEEAMMNVQDALEELKAAFAELTGDEPAEDEGEEMEVEMPEMEAVESVETEEVAEDTSEELEEGAEMKAVSVSHADGSDSAAKSPVGPGEDMGGKAVDIAGSEESGGSAPAAKPMGVDGPQEAGEPRAVKG